MVEVVFFDVDVERPLTYERRWYKKKIADDARARKKKRKRTTRPRAGRNDARNARGEKRRMRWKSSRVLFGGRFGGAFGWRAVARFSFFRPILRRRLRALSESDDDDEKECCCVLFARETKLTDENVPPPPPLDANSQVEEETNPQIETQAQKDAHEIEVIFSTQNERKRFQNR